MVPKILVVDDSNTNRLIIMNMLKEFEVIPASNGLQALDIINRDLDIDLIILDLNMPEMNGFELLEELKNNQKYQKLRVIILTNFDEIDNEIKGLELGAVDYIRKPVNIQSLRIRIDIHLKLKQMQKEVERDNAYLDRLVAEKTAELQLTRDITIHALVGLLEVRNFESFNHTMRTQLMMRMLCHHLQKNDHYQSILTDAYINELATTTPLHDIGKVGIPDEILLKPGKLTPDEYNIMKKHVNYGVLALKSSLKASENTPGFIQTAIEIVENHHEKYDGTGYPKGLKGTDIPLPGRLMAIIDVFDALISKRVYKDAFSYDESIQIITDGIGTHFDPDIAKSFLSIIDKIHLTISKYLN